MATTVAAVDPQWADGVTFSAKELRQSSGSALYPAAGGTGPVLVESGVVPGNADLMLKVSPSSGMTIIVAAGWCAIQGTEAVDQGVYITGLVTSGLIDVPAAHATLARYDLIVAAVDDNGDATTAATVHLVQGTPSASPVEPAVPANSTTLARITVAAAVSSITAGAITDRRVWVVPSGGVRPSTSGATIANPYTGMLRYDTDTHSVRAWDGTAWQQVGARHAPRGAIAFGYNTVNSSAWNSTTDVTVQTLGSVATVAGRRYKITSHFRIGNGGGTNTAGDLVALRHKVGGVTKGEMSFVTTSASSGIAPDCGTFTTLINDATTASVTVTLTGANLSGSGSHQILASASVRCFLLVEDLGSLV